MELDKYHFSDNTKILHVRWTDDEGSYIRSTYAPGSDITHLPQSIQDAAAAMWTQDVIDAYQAAQQESV